jgi:hypothetical protein
MSHEKPQKVIMDTVYSLADLRDILNGLTTEQLLATPMEHDWYDIDINIYSKTGYYRIDGRNGE